MPKPLLFALVLVVAIVLVAALLRRRVALPYRRVSELFTAAENLFNVKYATAATPVTQLGLPITARFGLRYELSRR